KAKNAADFVLYGEPLNWTNPEILLSECVALSLAERAFAARWSLDRKFCEAMQAAGVEWKGQRDVLYRAFVLAKISGLDLAAQSKTKKSGKAAASKKTAAANPAALALASLCCESADAAALSRANSFDNVVWFNKEELDRSLFLAAQNEFILGINSDKDILAFYKLMAAAQEKAQYKCRALVEQFEPQKPKAKKAASKKAEAKKAPAKKAATKTVKAAAKSAENKTTKKVAKTAPKKAAATTKQSKAKSAAKATGTLEKNKKALKKAGGRNMAETTAKKPAAKKAPAKKPAAKKPAAKKAPAKKTAEKKTVAKKAAAKKPAAKKPAAKKAPAKKTAAKKPVAKKAPAKKAPAKKTTAAKKPAAKKAPAKKPAAK
ncbi:MAG: histone H1-like repetitive region-containing protein, partial [Treponema sp.]|nr:histone H1-like repetitive region-containing protein [Treponema sp.]